MPDNRYSFRGSTSGGIAASIEGGIASGALAPGTALPPVRVLARELGVAPATVATAYRTLRDRGLVLSAGRRGTTVATRSLLTPSGRRTAPPIVGGVRNLAHGNPDPALLPPFADKLSCIPGDHHLYGQGGNLPHLIEWAREDFARDGIRSDHLTVVAGALDGIWRVLDSHLRPGQRVVVEDPGHCGLLDVLSLLGLLAQPVPVDGEGMRPDALAAALAQRPAAVVLTSRLQSPTGAALSRARAEELHRLLCRHPDLLIVEDDHSALLADLPMCSVIEPDRTTHWAVVRSVAKALGPDLRVGLLAADGTTIARVDGRMQSGMGWVSYLLQHLTIALLRDPEVLARVASARTVYRERREALVSALDAQGLRVSGRSGFNVWLPVQAESMLVQRLSACGWAVRAGEAFRLVSPAGVRITAATLEPVEAIRFAAAVVECLSTPGPGSP